MIAPFKMSAAPATHIMMRSFTGRGCTIRTAASQKMRNEITIKVEAFKKAATTPAR